MQMPGGSRKGANPRLAIRVLSGVMKRVLLNRSTPQRLIGSNAQNWLYFPLLDNAADFCALPHEQRIQGISGAVVMPAVVSCFFGMTE